MVYFTLMCVMITATGVHGKRWLPSLPVENGCYQASPEVDIFRVEGEAVILYFPIFMRTLELRDIAPPPAQYVISRNNGTEQTAYEDKGRVQQHGGELWLLPARLSDSGKYTCTYRNETFCVTGSITLHMYESYSADVKALTYPWSAKVGENVEFHCPALDRFNKTGRPIEWHKDFNSAPLQPGRATLTIPAVKLSHAGVYTCRLTVLINNLQYKVSRAYLLHVEGSDPAVTTSVPVVTKPSGAGQPSSSTLSTVSIMKPPVIVSPIDGTIFESSHGSGLELFCQVVTECQLADSTAVTWLVNGQSVESSYLDRRALQGGRRVTRVSGRCQIEVRFIISAITEEDEKTEMKCVTQNTGGKQEVVTMLRLEDTTFTWLVVGVVTASCFLMVVCVFLYVLFKPKSKKKMDYILARQSSTFSV
ncbi:PREDICTED: interleukin-1 receptor type 2-like [Poecilia mexicana]|uniref:Ig-like domain-containing protein n=1 Tax=Poecilia mexicana TaxID=48701 RepID=A0A3B3XKB3_9TELE|nr:PREDICTED: interleukin-1 receptor type 2-like [Poecilia mexicana]XP_014857223.1 PREDICTED: interleukin-1 receptor type 2-like [Poecilia mexicana]XP_014857225.1 PREDICTED: interleukin-1 receptor type 2-like [Poecilia mexicana]